MKLRIEATSLRLRLSAAEVDLFRQQGRLASVVPLGPGPAEALTYALERTESAEFRVSYGAAALTVKVPAALADQWTQTDQNGISATLMVAHDQPLRILIEKDLDCRH